MPKRRDIGRETAAADVVAANKRGRAAGIAAVRAATQRGLTIVNHGAGTMPVGAPAPHGGERYSLLEDHEHAQQPYTVAAHDGTKGADGELVFVDAPPEFRPSLTPAECIRRASSVAATSTQEAARRASSGVTSQWMRPSFLRPGLPICPRRSSARGGTTCPRIAMASRAASAKRSGRARVGYTCKTLEDGSSGTAASTWADAAPTTRASVHAGARAPHHAAGGGTSFAVPSLAMVAAGRTPPSRRSSARRCCTGHTS